MRRFLRRSNPLGNREPSSRRLRNADLELPHLEFEIRRWAESSFDVETSAGHRIKAPASWASGSSDPTPEVSKLQDVYPDSTQNIPRTCSLRLCKDGARRFCERCVPPKFLLYTDSENLCMIVPHRRPYSDLPLQPGRGSSKPLLPPDM